MSRRSSPVRTAGRSSSTSSSAASPARAQFIATIADLFGGRGDGKSCRAGRYLALAGALISPVLLILDLHKKKWHNMLRIYRSTSAMSVGAWALSLFGAFSGLVAAGQFLDDRGFGLGRTVARLAQIPAAMAGGVVALYTGTLMAATAAPVDASAFPFLSSLFASSAASTAAAALTVAAEATGAPASSKRKLNLVALIAGAAELIFALLVDRKWRGEGAQAWRTRRRSDPPSGWACSAWASGGPLASTRVQALLPRLAAAGAVSAVSALSAASSSGGVCARRQRVREAGGGVFQVHPGERTRRERVTASAAGGGLTPPLRSRSP